MDNILRPRRPKKFNEAQVAEIRKRYLEGATTRELSVEFNANRQLISFILKGGYEPRKD